MYYCIYSIKTISATATFRPPHPTNFRSDNAVTYHVAFLKLLYTCKCKMLIIFMCFCNNFPMKIALTAEHRLYFDSIPRG